jgi:hypothetical protein
MSVPGHARRFGRNPATSALLPIATVSLLGGDRRKGPFATNVRCNKIAPCSTSSVAAERARDTDRRGAAALAVAGCRGDKSALAPAHLQRGATADKRNELTSPHERLLPQVRRYADPLLASDKRARGDKFGPVAAGVRHLDHAVVIIARLVTVAGRKRGACSAVQAAEALRIVY